MFLGYLIEDYSEDIITQVLEKALECHCYSVDGVKQLVMRLTESLEKASPTSEMAEASIAESVVSVEPVDWPEVGQFDRLLQRNTEVKTEANAEAERSET